MPVSYLLTTCFHHFHLLDYLSSGHFTSQTFLTVRAIDWRIAPWKERKFWLGSGPQSDPWRGQFQDCLFLSGESHFVDWLDHKESGAMSGKQSKDLMVPAWFLSAIDLITIAQKTTKITGICIQIIKDIVDWLETTSGFSVAVSL